MMGLIFHIESIQAIEASGLDAWWICNISRDERDNPHVINGDRMVEYSDEQVSKGSSELRRPDHLDG